MAQMATVLCREQRRWMVVLTSEMEYVLPAGNLTKVTRRAHGAAQQMKPEEMERDARGGLL